MEYRRASSDHPDFIKLDTILEGILRKYHGEYLSIFLIPTIITEKHVRPDHLVNLLWREHLYRLIPEFGLPVVQPWENEKLPKHEHFGRYQFEGFLSDFILRTNNSISEPCEALKIVSSALSAYAKEHYNSQTISIDPSVSKWHTHGCVENFFLTYFSESRIYWILATTSDY